MQNILINEQGALVCPACGAVDNFDNRRRGLSKLAVAPTGALSVLVLPKRMQCLGCRTYLKGPPLRTTSAPRAPAPMRVKTVEGGIPIILTGSDASGRDIDEKLKSCLVGLTVGALTEARTRLMTGKPYEVVRCAPEHATSVAQHLRNNGFSVAPLSDDEPPLKSGLLTSGGSDDVLERLERLAALRERGMLSEDEFEAQKARLLNG